MIDIIGNIIKNIQNILFIKNILPTDIYNIVSYEENEKTFLGKVNVILLHIILLLILFLIIVIIKNIISGSYRTVKYFTGKGLNEQFTFGSTLSPINY